MTSQNPSRDVFANSRWSLVLRQADSSSQARDALSDLAHRYGYPVYTYIRCCGHAADDGLKMTHAFLQQMVDGFGTRTVGTKTSTPYRAYLFEQLRAFMDGDTRAAMKTVNTGSADMRDLEPRYLRDHVSPLSSEHAFQRSFALEVLHRALIRLRMEAEQTGHQDMFNALEPFLARDPEPETCGRIAAALTMRPLVLMLALKRLRQRLRELAGEELADTVHEPAHVSTEQDLLLGVLRAEPEADRRQ